MSLTRKQLDRLGPLLKSGLQVSRRIVAGVEARRGDLVLLSSGQYLDLYIVIDRAGQTRQRKAVFH